MVNVIRSSVILLSIGLIPYYTQGMYVLGKCPKYDPIERFNIAQFAGHWYEVERSFYFMELIQSCTNLNFTLTKRGNLDVDIITVNKITLESSISRGIAVPMHNGSSILRYKVHTKLPFPVARLLPGAGLYNILRTDYVNYAILWSCSHLAFFHTDSFWILGRQRDLPEKIRINVYETLRHLHLDPERLIFSQSLGCLGVEPVEEDSTNKTLSLYDLFL